MTKKNISDVNVFKVSLVTKDNNPAVEEAETKHSIFKIFGGRFTSKDKISKQEETQLDTIVKTLQPIAKLEDGDYLDIALERDDPAYKDAKKKLKKDDEDDMLDSISKTLEPIAKDLVEHGSEAEEYAAMHNDARKSRHETDDDQ